MKSTIGRSYGWIPDLPDHRDFEYAVSKRAIAKLLPHVDLRTGCPIVYDQGQLGSCTANAIGGAHQFEQIKLVGGVKAFIPSRLMIYYDERAMEGTIGSDSGAQIRDGMKSVAVQGVCPETMWPYNIKKFTTKPTPACFVEGKKHLVTSYMRVLQTLDQMKGCLAAGFPFVFGFSVYESFESAQVAKTGIVPMPGKNESCLGGHAVMAVGYDDPTKRFIVRNSWGTGWGMAGYFTIPYQYLTNINLASDFWTVRLVLEG